MYNGKAMILSTIKQDDVRYVIRIIASNICASSKEDELSAGFIYAAYKIVVDKEQVNLCEILIIQLIENLEKIKKIKNGVFRFESLFCHIFFYVLRRFPFLSMIEIMDSNKCIMEKTTDV